MVNTSEEIMLTLAGQDNASQMFANVDKNAQSMASNLSSAMSKVNMGLMNIGQVSDNVMQGLTGKSALDNIFGTTSKAETNAVLLKNMLDDTGKNYDKFYEKVDKTTDSSLTSMQELIPALKAFKSATGATDKEMTNITDEMANFGAAVLAQTGSTDLAQQSMMDLSKGIKGAFASLDQYGITQDALQRTGYWNGDEKDVEGFMKAVQKVTGSTEELMETNTGLDALIGKAFSRAGKKIGNEFLPFIKDIKRGFIDLDSELGGGLAASMLVVSGGVDAMNQGFWNISTTVNGIRDLKDGFVALKDIVKGTGDAAKTTGDAINTISNVSDAGSGISGLAEVVDDVSDIGKKLDGAEDIADVVDDVSDIGKKLEGAEDIAEGLEAAAGAGAAASAAGPEMAAGAAGAEAAAAGATGLSAAFTSMIVPLLALSAVIIIMIPIVAFIAAEAMFFLKLLADFMQALNFDSIDLDGAVKGISQVATALAWVGVAMLALVAVNITTQLAAVTSMFLGMTGPLDVAVNAIKEAAQKLAQFNSTGLDPSVAKNITAVAEALSAISNAMGALTWNNIVTGFSNFIAGALGFGSVTDGLEQAKNDIMEASNKLNEFSGMTALDSSVAQNIQNVCNSLASVGEAMSALRSLRDGQNWDSMIGDFLSGIFGEGVDIQTALMNVKDDIIKASQALAEFTGISEIPEDVSGKIQKVGSTLTAVNDTVNNIKEVVGSGFDNWVEGLFGGYDVAGGLEKIKNDLITASQKLAELSALSAIDEGITEKVTQIGTALQKVNEVSTTLTTLGDSGIGEFDSSIISTAVTNIQTAATELAKLNEVQFDGAAADTMLGAIQTTLENVKATLAAASGFTEASMSIGSQIISGVQQGLAPLPGTIQSTVSSAINSAGSAALSGGAMLGRAATEGMKSSLKLADAVNEQVNYALNAMTSRESEFYAAGAALGSAMSKGFESTKGQNVGSPGKMAREIERQMNYGLQFMYDAVSPFYNAGVKLGRQISDGFGNPSLDASMFTAGGSLTAEHIGALKTTISNAPDKTDNRPVTIIVQEGAVNVDARNYTTKEAQGLMITALEGMDTITNVSVNGG